MDLASACRPARGVGGDHYDMIELENGCLGLAIGDVSGKGISAALLMASLRASLRAGARIFLEAGAPVVGLLPDMRIRREYPQRNFRCGRSIHGQRAAAR